MTTDIYSERNLFSTREVPWMKLGTVIEDQSVSAAKAVQLGGLDFDVELRPGAWQDTDGTWREATNRLATVRKDTGTFFEFVSANYGEPVQYREAAAFLDEISPEFVAAGALNEGRAGFIVVRFPGQVQSLTLDLDGKSDLFDLYGIFRTSHDTTRGIEIAMVSLRGKCMNQLTLPSLTARAKQRWSIRHCKTVRDRMLEAQRSLANASAYADEFARIAAQLADIDVEWDQARAILTDVLPNRPRRDEQLAEVMATYEHSPYNGFQGTGWGLVNAVSEYFEWQRPSTERQTPMSQFLAVLDGTIHKMVAETARRLLVNPALN